MGQVIQLRHSQPASPETDQAYIGALAHQHEIKIRISKEINDLPQPTYMRAPLHALADALQEDAECLGREDCDQGLVARRLAHFAGMLRAWAKGPVVQQ